MTEAELQAIKKRAEAATPGPWIDTSTKEEVGTIRSCDTYTAICTDPDMDDREADRTFIANAREDIPRLLGYVEKLEGLLCDLSVLDQDGAYQKGYEDGRRSVVGLLGEIQWCAHGELWYGPNGIVHFAEHLCPLCGEQEPRPHQSTCELGRVLQEVSSNSNGKQ